MSADVMKDLIEVLTMNDGEYNEEIQAYVTAYSSGVAEISVELEYVDLDNEEEVIEVKRFTIMLNED